MITSVDQRVMRRLTTAEGYLELGMPDQALSELRSIQDPGAFSVPHLLMTAAALKAQGKTEEASESLRKVAKNLPKVSPQDVWKVVGKFLSKLGQSVDSTGLEKIISTIGMKPIAMGIAHVEVPSSGEKAAAKDGEIRVEIPQFGTLAVKIEPGQSLTIKIERPGNSDDSEVEIESEFDDDLEDSFEDEFGSEFDDEDSDD